MENSIKSNEEQRRKMVEMVAEAQNGLDRVRLALEMKDDYVNQAFLSLDAKHEKFHSRFNDYFETITRDRKRIEATQLRYTEKVDLLTYSYEKLESFVRKTMSETINDIFYKNKSTADKLEKLFKEQAEIPRVQAQMRTLNNAVNDM